MRRSLANRAERLECALEQAQNLAQTAPPVLPDLDELEEMEDHDRDAPRHDRARRPMTWIQSHHRRRSCTRRRFPR